MATWNASPRVMATFVRAFPHVLTFDGGSVLIGSNDPIAPDPTTWLGRVLTDPVRPYLGPNVTADVHQALLTWGPPPHTDTALAPNRDLFPRDEFQTWVSSVYEPLGGRLD
jgi:hypothetical protein